MNIIEQTSHFSITEGLTTAYYAKGDLLIHKMSTVANAELWFVHRQTNQVVHIVNYNDITGYASSDVDDFIDKWIEDNPVAGGLPAGMTWDGTTFDLDTAGGFKVGPWSNDPTWTALGYDGYTFLIGKVGITGIVYNSDLVFYRGTVERGRFAGSAGNFAVGTTGPAAVGHFKSRLATDVAFIAEGTLGQDTDIQQWRLNGVTYGKFTKLGGITLLRPGVGVTLTSPDGLTTKTLTIDNSGAEVWT